MASVAGKGCSTEPTSLRSSNTLALLSGRIIGPETGALMKGDRWDESIGDRHLNVMNDSHGRSQEGGQHTDTHRHMGS